MTDCVFLWSCLQSEGFESCCATLSPQTVSTDLHRKGEGGGEGGGEGERGLSLENGPGPRPARLWPSNCARILMTCVYSMRAQMADRFKGSLCFLLHCFPLVSRQLMIIVSYWWKDNTSKHWYKQTNRQTPHQIKHFAVLIVIFICRAGIKRRMQLDKWLRGILLIHPSLHNDLFLFVYQLTEEKKVFFWTVLSNIWILMSLLEKLSGFLNFF